MSIRTKVFPIVLVLFMALGAADFVIQRFVIYPSFLDLERHEAGENVQRIFHAIGREVFHIERLTRDWATWDDSYDFLETRSEEFISSNLVDETLDNLSLNVLIFCDTNGTIIWSRARDLVSHTTLSPAFMSGSRIALSHPIMKVRPTEEGGQGCKGIFAGEQAPLIFSTREVLHSDRSGPARGYLIMGKFLNQTMVHGLQEQTRIPFEIAYPFRSENALCDSSGVEPMRSGELLYFMKQEGNYVRTCSAYSDVEGKPLFGVQYLFPREITRKGITSMSYAAVLVIASGAIILIMLNVMLQVVVLKPVQRLTRHAVRLQSEGDYSVMLNLERDDEVGQLARSFDTMVQTISERTAELQRANERLTQLSLRDGMTGVANRRMFDTYLKQEWRRAIREQAPLSVILADVDHFKFYNDTYGHQMGDQCLISVAAVMQQQMQRPADMVARYGGEEFAVILPNTDGSGAAHMAEVLRQAVLDLKIEHKTSPVAEFVTMSIGVVCIVPSPEEGDQGMDRLLEMADQALYRAKHSGRNAVRSGPEEPASEND